MASVSRKFFIASMFMWILPIAILYGFQHNWFPVVSVNVMLGFYIWMAMREPTDKHSPDPAFVAKAKASIASGGGNKQD